MVILRHIDIIGRAGTMRHPGACDRRLQPAPSTSAFNQRLTPAPATSAHRRDPKVPREKTP
jgi:hypothetical protein